MTYSFHAQLQMQLTLQFKATLSCHSDGLLCLLVTLNLCIALQHIWESWLMVIESSSNKFERELGRHFGSTLLL